MLYKVEGLSKIDKYHIYLTTIIKGLRPVMEGLNGVVAFTAIGYFFQLRLTKKLKINSFCFKELNINNLYFF